MLTKNQPTDKFDDASQNYTQTVSINDKVVATLSTKDGEAQGWGSAVECAAEDCGTVGAHCKLTLPTYPPIIIIHRQNSA